ncbi:MAG: Tm-1-like ATP-binding domain-containing protein, partial [Nitrospinota bacterium]
LANAAGAIVGMVEAGAALPRPERPAVGMTIYGNTTPAGMRAKGILEERGYEVMAFHPNGTGGAAMEELIQQGFFKAILDLSTHELTDHLVGGDHAGRENRLTVAGAHGLPQVVLPGGIDFIITGPPEAIPQELRGRAYVQHSVYMCLVRTSREEMAEVGRRTARKLNKALGPAKVIVPLRGFSYQGARGRPLHDTPSDMAYLEALREHLSPAIELIELDHNINDPPVAERACEELLAMMRRAPERKDA